MNPLTSLEAWEACRKSSAETPCFVFKHSTRCPISAHAKARLEAFLAEAAGDGPPVYMVLVVEDRPVSQAIAADLGVTHQSPQLILLEDGEAVWDCSHGRIDAGNIRAALNEREGN